MPFFTPIPTKSDLQSLFTAPGDKPEYWTLVFSRSQKDLPNNPAKAQYHDNWAATVQAYPWLGQEAKKVVADIKSNMAYEKLKWSNIDMNLPYTRICIPVRQRVFSFPQSIPLHPFLTLSLSPPTTHFTAERQGHRFWPTQKD